jgi:tape measure domain-containing protein
VTLAELFIRLSADTSDFGPKVKQAQKDLDGVQKTVEKLGSSLADFGARLTAAVSLPLAGAGLAALKMANEMEQASMAFKTMMGSAEAAQVHLDELKRFAAQTPFEFADLVQASKRMQALGFAAADVVPSLRSIGNAASALGMAKEGIDRITTALGQMMAKGKVQAEEMRQLAEAGIPAWQILAKTLNTDVAGAMKMVEQRAVDASVAVPALMEGMNKKFGGLMEQQMQTIGGMWSNLKDQIGFTLADIGKAMTPWAKDIMANVLSPMLEKVKELSAAFGTMNPKAQTAAMGLGALAVAGPPLIAALGYMIQGIGAFGKALQGVIPLVTSPAGIAVALGVTLVGALGVLAYKAHEANVEFEKTAANFEKFQQAKARQAESGIVGPVNTMNWEDIEFTQASGFGKGLSRGISVQPIVDNKAALEADAKAAEEYAQKWAKAMSALGIESNRFREMEVALVMLNDKLKAHGIDLGKTTTAYTILATAQANGIITSSQFRDAVAAFGKEWEKAHPWVQQVALDLSENKENMDAFRSAMAAADAQNLGRVFDRIAKSTFDAAFALDSLPEKVNHMAEMTIAGVAAIDDAYKTLGIKSSASLQEAAEKAQSAYYDIEHSGVATAVDIQRAWVAMVAAQIDAGEKLDSGTITLYERLKTSTASATKQMQSSWKTMMQQVSTAINDLAKSLTDVIFGTKAIGEAFTDLGKTIVRIILEQIIANGIAKLMNALSGVLSSLGEIGKALGGIFGGSGGGGVLGTTVGAASTVGGAASSAGGAGGSAAAGSAMSTVLGIAGLGVSIASGIVSGIQGARTNNLLAEIEASTRYTWLAVGGSGTAIAQMAQNLWAWAQNSDKLFWGVTEPLLTGMSANLDDIAGAVSAMHGASVSSGGGMTITVNGPLVQVSGSGQSADAIAAAVMRAIPTQIKRYTNSFAPVY